MPHQISPELFISFIPGSRLEDEIAKVIDYCEQNNCLSLTLTLNRFLLLEDKKFM
jgi:hypothetical protein